MTNQLGKYHRSQSGVFILGIAWRKRGAIAATDWSGGGYYEIGMSGKEGVVVLQRPIGAEVGITLRMGQLAHPLFIAATDWSGGGCYVKICPQLGTKTYRSDQLGSLDLLSPMNLQLPCLNSVNPRPQLAKF